MSPETQFKLTMATIYAIGLVAIYLVLAFVRWDFEPTMLTRIIWVCWTFYLIGSIIEDCEKDHHE